MPNEVTESKLTTGEQIASLWSLGGLSVRQLSKKVYQAITDDYILDRASALAFNFILALFPLLLFLVALLGAFASRGTAMRGNLLSYLSLILPPAAYQVVFHSLIEFTRNSGG